MKVCMVGEGAQGITHIEALKKMDDVEIVSVAGGIEADARAFASEHGIDHVSTDLEECLDQPGVEAAVITSPTQLHSEQTIMALEKGINVLLELPVGLSLEESQRVAEAEEKSGKVAMLCHTHRFNPIFRAVRGLITAGDLHLHHIVQHTYFFRRINENRFGKPRIWTDDLLWHQACHTIDMIYWLLGDPDMSAWGHSGPMHETLGVPMDITISLESADGCMVTSAASFNHHGPIQGDWRFIGEEETYVTDRRALFDHQGNEVTLPDGPSGVDAQDAEFFAAIREGRKALTSATEILPVMGIIDRVQKAMDGRDGAPSLGMVEITS